MRKSPPCGLIGPVDEYSDRRTAGSVYGMCTIHVDSRVSEDAGAELESRAPALKADISQLRANWAVANWSGTAREGQIGVCAYPCVVASV